MNTFPGVISGENAVNLPRFQTKDGENAIVPQRILYLMARINYTIFFLETGEQVLTTLPLACYASLLEAYGFVRIHKSYLLNKEYLQKCIVEKYNFIVLPPGEIVEIARRRRTKLKQMFKSL